MLCTDYNMEMGASQSKPYLFILILHGKMRLN